MERLHLDKHTPSREEQLGETKTRMKVAEKQLEATVADGLSYYTRMDGVTDQAVFAPVHALVNDYLQSDRTSAWDFETKIKAAVTRAVGRTKITWFVHNLGIRTSEINAWRNRFDEIRRGDQAVLDKWVVKRKTGYKTDADKMDAGRSESSGPYWGLKLELFARAFEAITADTAHAKNLASPFLVPPQCNNALWQTGKPYPEGEEREAFVKSFVPLLRELPLYIEKPRQTAVDLTQVETSRAASVAGP